MVYIDIIDYCGIELCKDENIKMKFNYVMIKFFLN